MFCCKDCFFILISYFIGCVFSAAELLREAEKLIDQKIHPQTIIAGWRRATEVARSALLNAALDHRYYLVFFY